MPVSRRWSLCCSRRGSDVLRGSHVCERFNDEGASSSCRWPKLLCQLHASLGSLHGKVAYGDDTRWTHWTRVNFQARLPNCILKSSTSHLKTGIQPATREPRTISQLRRCASTSRKVISPARLLQKTRRLTVDSSVDDQSYTGSIFSTPRANVSHMDARPGFASRNRVGASLAA